MKEAAAHPWWSSGGSEICRFCLQHYHYEMEIRCVRCDEAVCPMCIADGCCPDCALMEEG